ncbi:MAG: hypothetical protein RL033_6039 [Pseudomonadota bacterium]|jgi:hypothetical protein
MKFLMTYEANPNAGPPTPEQMAAIGQLTQEMMQKGVVVMTGGLVRPSKGTRVKMHEGKFSVTDGPFAETKELIDGFALIVASSQAEAIEHARRFMSCAGDGQGEILRVFDPMEMQG